MRDRDKFRGCLLGGAVGDALGLPVEFKKIDQIREIYGEGGITSYSLKNGVARISDDTQMTLFTANGLLVGMTRGMTRGIAASPESYCWRCYKAWLTTQTEAYESWKKEVGDITRAYPWLIRLPELHHRRAPGNTVMGALGRDKGGTIREPINDSKGCGGIMRVAPIGLYFDNTDASMDEICMYGAGNAALTHGHDLGYIPAAAFVYIINRIVYNYTTLEEIIVDCIQKIKAIFADKPHAGDFAALMEEAITLSKSDMDDVDAITRLGEGWTAEETLAIAVYCSLKYTNDFEKAVIASVNHSGDSDSTGSVTGNITGAINGCKNIPEKFITDLELRETILEIADDLCADCQTDPDENWMAKYAS